MTKDLIDDLKLMDYQIAELLEELRKEQNKQYELKIDPFEPYQEEIKINEEHNK